MVDPNGSADGESMIGLAPQVEAVRRRPPMYIGSTDTRGLHSLLWNVIDLVADQRRAGLCRRIEVTLRADGAASVWDDGPGYSPEVAPAWGRPAVEAALLDFVTERPVLFHHLLGALPVEAALVDFDVERLLLPSDRPSLKHIGDLLVANSLSEWLEVEIGRGGSLWRLRSERGRLVTGLERVGTATETGTTITFRPDPAVFVGAEFDFGRIAERLRALAYLLPGLGTVLRDERDGREESWCGAGGLADYVRLLNAGAATWHEPWYRREEPDGQVIEIAAQYRDDGDELFLSFVDEQPLPGGGPHESGFRWALTRALGRHGRRRGLLAAGAGRLVGPRTRRGLTAVFSLHLTDPQFAGATRDRLGNRELRPMTAMMAYPALCSFFDEYPEVARRVIERAAGAPASPLDRGAPPRSAP